MVAAASVRSDAQELRSPKGRRSVSAARLLGTVQTQDIWVKRVAGNGVSGRFRCWSACSQTNRFLSGFRSDVGYNLDGNLVERFAELAHNSLKSKRCALGFRRVL